MERKYITRMHYASAKPTKKKNIYILDSICGRHGNWFINGGHGRFWKEIHKPVFHVLSKTPWFIHAFSDYRKLLVEAGTGFLVFVSSLPDPPPPHHYTAYSTCELSSISKSVFYFIFKYNFTDCTCATVCVPSIYVHYINIYTHTHSATYNHDCYKYYTYFVLGKSLCFIVVKYKLLLYICVHHFALYLCKSTSI